MKIIRDHVLGEFLGVFLSSFFSLLFILLAGRGFVQMADLVFNKDVDPLLLVQLFAFTAPFLLTFIIPMSVLIATLLTFGRLSHDNEITALRASGVGIGRLCAPLIVFVALMCLGSYILSDRVASTSHYAYRRLLTRIGIENPAAALEEGTFIKKFKNFVIFIYEIDRNRLKGIRIYQPQEGKPTRTIVAERGELVSIPEQGIIKLRLEHGVSDEPDPKDPSKLYKLNFKTYELPLNVGSVSRLEELGKKPKDMTVRELRDEIRRLGADGIRATYPLSTEIHNKIALALSSLGFLLIGIPLGITTRRSERSVNFGISLLVMTLYWTILIGGKALAQKGLAPPFWSMQCSNFLIGGAGVFLLARLARR